MMFHWFHSFYIYIYKYRNKKKYLQKIFSNERKYNLEGKKKVTKSQLSNDNTGILFTNIQKVLKSPVIQRVFPRTDLNGY